MEKFVSSLEPRFRHAIEFRHRSWFTPETYRLLEKNNVAMAWSINQYLETPTEVTADFVCTSGWWARARSPSSRASRRR